MSANKTVLVIGSLDTKGSEYQYLLTLIEENGYKTIVLDFGIMGNSKVESLEGPEVLAERAGYTLEQLRSKGDRGEALEVMTIGLRKACKELLDQGAFDACIGMGGGGGTSVISSVMRELPIGMPKLILSTLASGDVSSYVGVKDITMMFSVVDIAGLNRISRKVISNAAGGICGMLGNKEPERSGGEGKLYAASMFGVTTKCVTMVRELLENEGHELIVFHATGSGGRSMEALIESGFFDGVLDITTTEWCDEIVGGVLSAGPNRLEAAAESGVPQVVSLGALDMVNFWAMDTVPAKFRDRLLYKHNSNVTLMRTEADELEKIARVLAQKLSKSHGATKIFVPLRGLSEMDKVGGLFHDTQANEVLFDTLRKHISPDVELVELDAHINDKSFAEALVASILDMTVS